MHSVSHQIGAPISSNNSSIIVVESALKLYIKEMVLLKPLLLGATLARVAVQNNSLVEWLISQRLTCYHRCVYTRQEHKATELYKYFIRLNVR